MNIIWKIIFLVIAIDLIGLIYLAYRKRSSITLGLRITESLSKIIFLKIWGILKTLTLWLVNSRFVFLLKKHRIITTCIILFALIYPTILFVYIKYIIYSFVTAKVSFIYFFTLFPIFWLIYKKGKLSPLSVLGISFLYLVILLLLTLFFKTPNFRFWKFILPFLGMPILYFTAFLFMGLLKKKITYWWLILLICNIALVVIGIINYHVNYTHAFSYLNDLTNIRTETECLKLNKQDACPEKYYGWRYGVCIWGVSYCAKGQAISGPLEG